MNLWSSLLIVIKSCYMWRFHNTGFKIPWCFPLNEGTTTLTSWIWLTNHSQRKWSCANYRSQTIWKIIMSILSLRKSPRSTWGGSWLWVMPSINCQLWEKNHTERRCSPYNDNVTRDTTGKMCWVKRTWYLKSQIWGQFIKLQNIN